jgi:hypothetical protein
MCRLLLGAAPPRYDWPSRDLVKVVKERVGRVENRGQALPGLGVEVGLAAGLVDVGLSAEVEPKGIAHQLGAAAVIGFTPAIDLASHGDG